MKAFKGKAIYNPSGKAGEYAKWACNFYTGCSNQCDYCYCRKGVMSHVWSKEPKLKKCFENEYEALDVFYKECKQNHFELKKNGLFFTFTSDPFLRETIQMTVDAAQIASGFNIPTMFLTKRADFVDYIKSASFIIMNKYKFAFGFTLTGHDELEPYASKNIDRIRTMKQLHNLGFRTFASIEPIVDFPSSLEMIKISAQHCDLFKVGLMGGKKYNEIVGKSFVQALMEMKSNRFYIKDSLQKLTGYTNSDSSNFVESNFNIFTI